MTELRSQELIWYASQRADRLRLAVELAHTMDVPVTPPYAGETNEQIVRLPQRWALRIHPRVLDAYAKATSDILATTRWFLTQPGHESLQPLQAVLERELALYQHAILAKRQLPPEVVEIIDDLAEPDILNELSAAPLRWLAELDTEVIHQWHQDWEMIRTDLVQVFGIDADEYASAATSLTDRLENLETDLEGIRTQLRAAGSALRATTA